MGSQVSVRRSLWWRRPGGSFGNQAVRVSRRLVLRGWRGRPVGWSESSKLDESPWESRADPSWQRGGEATDSWQGHSPEDEALWLARHFGADAVCRLANVARGRAFREPAAMLGEGVPLCQEGNTPKGGAPARRVVSGALRRRWPARNRVNLRVGSGVQQTHSRLRGASR
jgi:hypothetical protein